MKYMYYKPYLQDQRLSISIETSRGYFILLNYTPLDNSLLKHTVL